MNSDIKEHDERTTPHGLSSAESAELERFVMVGDTVICLIDEWRSGRKNSFDGTVLSKNEKGTEVAYLSGYRSRNDFVEWNDVVAKVDLSLPMVSTHGFVGQFRVFKP
jgi:hypothetical protein